MQTSVPNPPPPPAAGERFKQAALQSGKTGNTLRGDYSAIGTDFTISQDWAGYRAEEHERWRALCRRQATLLRRYASASFIQCLERLEAGDAIPDFRRINDRLGRATGWQLVAVPGLIPDAEFFAHLAARRFPVTHWLRSAAEMDYLVEPDLFHDFFGHVPLLLHPVFADYLQAYGQGGLRALGLGRLDNLARLYWYTVEFGLVREDGDLKVYGAGILSSAGETPFAIDSPSPHRLAFNLERVMRTRVRIDDYQQVYFVIDTYQDLFDATAADFAPLYRTLAQAPDLAPDALLPSDRLISRGSQERARRAG